MSNLICELLPTFCCRLTGTIFLFPSLCLNGHFTLLYSKLGINNKRAMTSQMFKWLMHFLINLNQSEPRGTPAHHLTLAPSSDTSTSNSTFSPTTVWTSSSSLVMVTGGSEDKFKSAESHFETAKVALSHEQTVLLRCVSHLLYCTLYASKSPE